MNKNILLIAAAALAIGGVGFALGANVSQEPQDAAAMMPKPGAEHKVLGMDAGKWNANVKVWMAPDAPPMEMSGMESNDWTCNGLWMTSTFDMPDGSFSGRSLAGWDAHRKQYVSAWVDSSTLYFAMMTGTYDAAKKTMTFKGEAPDHATGKMNKTRSTLEHVDANTRRYTSWTVGADGKETKGLEITYNRAK